MHRLRLQIPYRTELGKEQLGVTLVFELNVGLVAPELFVVALRVLEILVMDDHTHRRRALDELERSSHHAGILEPLPGAALGKRRVAEGMGVEKLALTGNRGTDTEVVGTFPCFGQ